MIQYSLSVFPEENMWLLPNGQYFGLSCQNFKCRTSAALSIYNIKAETNENVLDFIPRCKIDRETLEIVQGRKTAA